MRFTGRIRFQDIDTGDLDVSVEVDDTHVHLRSGDESLGSWCLADVVASRLVANEFEIDLGGETVVFEADDQVNFAYGAVQKMAEGWARYHSMNVLVRHRAIASGRRKNEPSRLDEARRAFTAARDDLYEPTEESIPEPVERDEAVAESPIGRLTRHRSGGATGWGPVDDGPGDGPDEEDDLESDTAADQPPATTDHIGSNGDRSGGDAGAAAVADERGRRPPSPLEGDDPPDAAAETDAVAGSGERPESSKPDRPRHPDLPPPKGRLPRLDAFPRSESEEEPGAGSAGADPDHADRPGSPDDGADAGPESPSLESDAAPTRPAPEPDLQPGGGAADRELPASPADPTGEDDRAVPEEAAEEAAAEAPTPAGPGASRVEPSPGAFGDGHHPSETSGLRASLRSMFSKADEHEHSFVTSTTAVGLTRHVCLECGHVSIGVDE